MKKILSIFLVSLIVLSLFACGKKQEADVTMNAELSHPSASEDEVNEERAKQESRSTASSKVTYYDDINTLIMALKNNKINLAYLGESVARYVMAKDADMGYVLTEYSLPNEYSLCMRDADIELINLMNEAIKNMKSDGTLQKLENDYIENVINGDEPKPIELEQIEGRRTINVAVTGDVPPMDYITADGKPAGFNVALLKEISERCNVNITITQINSQARAASLMSGKVDCLFWTVIEQSPSARMKYKDVPKDAIISDPYYSTQGVNLYYKKNEKTMNYINNRMKAVVEIH